MCSDIAKHMCMYILMIAKRVSAIRNSLLLLPMKCAHEMEMGCVLGKVVIKDEYLR